MLRRGIVALIVLSAITALIVSGCQDDDTGGKPSAASSPSSFVGLPTATPTPGRLATPTPIPDTAVALSVARGGKIYAPTGAELKALPTADINAGGPKKGISIATIGEKVGATDASIVTIQGIRADGRTVAFVRKTFTELATTTVLVLDEHGHLSIASTSLDPAEWLQSVVSITFAP